MPGHMRIRIWDVEHGMCAMVQHQTIAGGVEIGGKLAMIDSGHSDEWRPSTYVRSHMGRRVLDYLFITNADQDHMSDLAGFDEAGVGISVLYRNPSYTGAQIRDIKLKGGPLSNDASWYADACSTFNQPVIEPFDQHMGGITASIFWNQYPTFTDTNNLSLAIFIKYQGFSILFPGDLEKPGWKGVLSNSAFLAELSKIDVLVASHHGRENGFSPDVFLYCQPQAVVISDKPIEHETQATVPNYRSVTTEGGVIVKTTGKRRHVLTTRRDGWIQFDVFESGAFDVTTEKQG